MSIRSTKLKIKTNSGANSKDLRQGLWGTHKMLNEGVCYYLDWLILLRQDKIIERENIRTKEMVQRELLKRIKEQHKRNGFKEENFDYSEILTVLRQLYEVIVPSSVEKKGDAQSLSGKFLSPLVDPNSIGGKGVSNAGRKSRWQSLKEKNDPNWEIEYEKYQVKKKVDSTLEILEKLEQFGLKPLLPLFTNTRKDISWMPLSKRQFVRNWDRDMFKQAIEKMLSWESWNHKVINARKKMQEKKDEYYQEYLIHKEDLVKLLQEYEEERAKQLEKDTGNISESYRINIRSVRGWEKISEKWLKSSQTETELWEIVKSVQKEMVEGFGDSTLYKYLAKPENHKIWSGSKERASLLKSYSIYNSIKNKLEASKELATFTWPDSINHPLWLRLEAPGGKNIYKYSIEKNNDGLNATFERLLWPSGQGWKEVKEITVQLAPSQQVERKIKNRKIIYVDILDKDKGKQQIVYRDYSSEIPFEGVLGGAKLQFDRRHLETCKDKLDEGEVGSVYFNISIDVNPLQEMKNGRLQTPLGKALKVVQADRSKGVAYPKVVDYKVEQLKEFINATNATTVKGVNSLTEGMRVISVDLGQRTSAAVSIFEVSKNQPNKDEKKMFFKIPDSELFAVHLRSLLLNLPGESTNNSMDEKRKQRNESYKAIRFQIRMLAKILKLHTKKTKEDRVDQLEKMLKGITEYDLWDNALKNLWKQEISKLREMTFNNEDDWKQEIVTVHHALESQVGKAVSEWKKSLTKERRGLVGLSMWNVDEINRTRKLLVSWSKRSRTPGKITSQEDKEKFGLNQLTHLQNLKEDRLKKMANLIVMTALGYKYDKNKKRWEEFYPSCQVILFEDLSRYRFNLDRPRRENSQLMKWAHRSIPRNVQMQGEIFGLQVGDVYSAFTSRFYAKTGAPGIRCHQLKEKDLNDKFIKEALIRDRFVTEEQWSDLKPGDIVPWKGGEVFVTVNSNDENKLSHIHADINAAQNLQRRFWTHKNELFRVSCRRSGQNEENVCIPSYQSDRWKKLMGKGNFVRESNFSNFEAYKWVKMSKMKINTTPSEKKFDLEDMEEINQAIEEDLEVRGEHVTLFRDPSGVFFSSNLWIPQVQFWSIVKNKIVKVLREKILNK